MTFAFYINVGGAEREGSLQATTRVEAIEEGRRAAQAALDGPEAGGAVYCVVLEDDEMVCVWAYDAEDEGENGDWKVKPAPGTPGSPHVASNRVN